MGSNTAMVLILCVLSLAFTVAFSVAARALVQVMKIRHEGPHQGEKRGGVGG